MARLNEEQAKHIVLNAQIASYPSRDVPEILKPVYTYIEGVEAENRDLRNELCLKCGQIQGRT